MRTSRPLAGAVIGAFVMVAANVTFAWLAGGSEWTDPAVFMSPFAAAFGAIAGGSRPPDLPSGLPPAPCALPRGTKDPAPPVRRTTVLPRTALWVGMDVRRVVDVGRDSAVSGAEIDDSVVTGCLHVWSPDGSTRRAGSPTGTIPPTTLTSVG